MSRSWEKHVRRVLGRMKRDGATHPSINQRRSTLRGYTHGPTMSILDFHGMPDTVFTAPWTAVLCQIVTWDKEGMVITAGETDAHIRVDPAASRRIYDAIKRDGGFRLLLETHEGARGGVRALVERVPYGMFEPRPAPERLAKGEHAMW